MVIVDRVCFNIQDYNEYVPAYQYSSAPAEDFADICHLAGFEILDCKAPEFNFAFENANHVKSKLFSLLFKWN